MASWRSGYAEDCKSLHPGSIPGEASRRPDPLAIGQACRGHRRNVRSRNCDGEHQNVSSVGNANDGAFPVTGPMAELRRAMVDCQLRTYDVTDKAVLAAMDTVPREAFVPPGQAVRAYLDSPLALGVDEKGHMRALMTPMVLARMIQALAIAPGEKVLDYAGGTGYSAAVLAQMGARVTAVEPSVTLREQAKAALQAAGHDSVGVTGDAATGDGGYDAILVNGACAVQPDTLLALLAPQGRLICVMGEGRAASVMLYQRSGGAMGARMVFDAAAPALAEFRKPAEFVF
jgi:protein-L-isoaspartate(D-aspartate) O-methyltransferase